MVDVNLIPKEYKKKKVKISTIFSKTGGGVLILIVLSLLLYGGLLIYKEKLNKDLDNTKNEIELLDQQRDPEIEAVIIDLDKKINILKDLFEGHFYWSQVLTKIEDLIISQAYFKNAKFTFLADKVNAVFTGNTLTYTGLARQLLSFQQEPLTEEARVSNIALSNEGGVDFNITVVFSKDILLK